MIYSPNHQTSRPATDWNIIIQEINADRRKTERRLSICLELAIITLAALAVWAVVVVVMEVCC